MKDIYYSFIKYEREEKNHFRKSTLGNGFFYLENFSMLIDLVEKEQLLD
jgi:hypothetical protein